MNKGYVLSDLIILVLLLLITLGLVIFAIVTIVNENCHYEYIDVDNNVGVAKYCNSQYDFECTLEDGTIKLVKEYKKVCDKESE